MKSKNLRLLLTVSGGRRFLFLTACGALVTTAAVIAQAYLIAAIAVGVIYDHPDILQRVMQLLALWIVRSLVVSQLERYAMTFASKVKAHLRAVVTRNSRLLITSSPSELTSLLVKGANALDIYIGRFIPQFLSSSLIPVIVIAVIYLHDPLSAVIAIVTLPLIPIFGALIGKYTEDEVSKKWKSLGTLSTYFEDSLRGITTLAIFGRARSQADRIREMGNRYTVETMKVLRISFLSALVLELCATISVALIAVSIGLRLVHSSMDFFPALVVLILAPEVYFPLRNAASLFHASADGVEALERLTAKSGASETQEWGSEECPHITAVSWGEFVSPFNSTRIPAGSVARGEVVRIDGDSGSGKTTLLYNLLGMRRDVAVSVNGTEVSTFTKSSYLRWLAWVPQSPYLLDGTIRDLFTAMDTEVSVEEIETLLARVGLSIAELPQGLSTVVGASREKSAHVSGGQLRRIAIARALFKNAELLILDEPTADLDEVSAAGIQSLISDLAQEGYAIVYVSHGVHDELHPARTYAAVQS